MWSKLKSLINYETRTLTITQGSQKTRQEFVDPSEETEELSKVRVVKMKENKESATASVNAIQQTNDPADKYNITRTEVEDTDQNINLLDEQHKLNVETQRYVIKRRPSRFSEHTSKIKKDTRNFRVIMYESLE